MASHTELSCTCGKVAMRVEGAPILTAECLCSDCQKAGAFFATLPGAEPIVDEKGATFHVVYRKDRVGCVRGAEFLREHRLTADTKTRRVVATCCNTPIFLDFTSGHWLDLFGTLWPEGTLPPLDLRTMTRDTPPGVQLPNDVPNPKSHNFGFFAKLLMAWAAMGFRVPKIDYVKGTLDAR